MRLHKVNPNPVPAYSSLECSRWNRTENLFQKPLFNANAIVFDGNRKNTFAVGGNLRDLYEWVTESRDGILWNLTTDFETAFAAVQHCR